MARLFAGAGLTAALLLGGCTTFGTNLHGSFACQAPGGTCAPMSVIDARAVATIASNDGEALTTGARRMVPGGARYTVAAREGGDAPARTSDRVLRIVFPAHIDAGGVYRDEATAHAVVENGTWVDGMTGGRPRSADAVAAALAPQDTAGPASASATALASLDEVIALRGAALPRPLAAQATTVPATVPALMPAPPLASPVTGVGQSPTRSSDPQTLAELAAAAQAPAMRAFDPVPPIGNYDAPDRTAVSLDRTAAIAGPVNVALAPVRAGPPAPGPEDYGTVATHVVRWHGHDYRIAYKHSPVVAVAAPPAAGSPATDALNAAVLAGMKSNAAVAAPAKSLSSTGGGNSAAKPSGAMQPAASPEGSK